MSSAAGKPTTCKDAIKRWEEENGAEAATALEVNLSFQWPPIEKMDNSLAVLAKCERLSLSTNMIEKVAGLSSLKKLRILSLGRNQIKGFTGLESLAETLEELWVSYNAIEKTKGLNALKNLRVLYMSNNLVREWNELTRLQEMPSLQELVFTGNPIMEGLEARWTLWHLAFSVLYLNHLKIWIVRHQEKATVHRKTEQWRMEVARRLPNLEKLDGEPLIHATAEELAAQQQQQAGQAQVPKQPEAQGAQ